MKKSAEEVRRLLKLLLKSDNRDKSRAIRRGMYEGLPPLSEETLKTFRRS